MPKKKRASDKNIQEIELTGFQDPAALDGEDQDYVVLDVPASPLGPRADGGHAPGGMETGYADPAIPAHTSYPGENYLTPMLNAAQNLQNILWSAGSDVYRGSEYMGPMTNHYLWHSLSGMPTALAAPIRWGFEASFYLSSQIFSAIAGEPVHTPTQRSLDLADAPPHWTYDAQWHDEAQALHAQVLAQFPGLDDIDEDGPDSTAAWENPSDSDSDSGGDDTYDGLDRLPRDDHADASSGAAGARSAGALESVTGASASASASAASSGSAQRPASPHHTASVPMQDAEPCDALPAPAASATHWLADTGLDRVAPGLTVGAAVVAYLLFNEVYDWNAVDCHLTGSPCSLFFDMPV